MIRGLPHPQAAVEMAEATLQSGRDFEALSRAGRGQKIARLRPAAALALLALAGCDLDPRDCLLGFSHGDCAFLAPRVTAFPQDDAICRGYGLVPGTRDYAICRTKKAQVRALTEHETDRGVFQGPLLPSPPP